MMNCQEFATLHKYGVDVKTIVLHNNVLGMVNQWQRMFYNGHCAESLIGDNPDLTAVSASMGVPGTLSTSRKTWLKPLKICSRRKGRHCSTSSSRLMKMSIPWFLAANAWTRWYWEVKRNDETTSRYSLRQ